MGLLALTRRVDQRVWIDLPDGRRIEVVVIELDRGRVKLGFAAPLNIRITRPEIGGMHDASGRPLTVYTS